MVYLQDPDEDIVQCIQEYLLHRDAVALSSTCRALRTAMRPSLFSSCHWRDEWQPPKTVWPYIRYLHVRSDAILGIYWSQFFLDLSNITSICASGPTITHELALILGSARNLAYMDLSSIGRQDWIGTGRHKNGPSGFEKPQEIPPLTCTPRAVKFCSRLGSAYAQSTGSECANKIHAFRTSFTSLLHNSDISQIEELEVGMEALCLPFAAAYAWTSLRTLILTGFSLHQFDEDTTRMNGHDITAHVPIYIGAIVAAAPCLRILRILYRHRISIQETQTHWLVCPARDERPPGRTVIPMLEELDLRNPAPDEGLLDQLPSTLRVLALTTYPHLCAIYSSDQDWAQEGLAPTHGTRTPEELMSLLEATAMPELRQLRLSFRSLKDMTLFERIVTRFPLLELLEIHGEIGPGCLWAAKELFDFAQALAPLTNLRCLHVNTFDDVFVAPSFPMLSLSDPQVAAAYEECASEQNIIRAFGPLTSVTELWLPASHTIRTRSTRRLYKRVWRVYHVLRDDGMTRLHPEDDCIEWVFHASCALHCSAHVGGSQAESPLDPFGLSSSESKYYMHRRASQYPNATSRHLHIYTDIDVLEKYEFLGDLGQLNSLHVCAETISPNLDFLLYKANNVDTLDLAHLCCKSPLKFDCSGHLGTPASYRLHYDALPEFHIITSRPRILRFCSRFDLVYGGAADVMMASKMRATRLPFVSLLARIDVASIQHLEVGVEALSLPSVAPYTWTSLRELILTGYMVSSPDDCKAIEDPRLGIPARMFENVHLGTLLASATRLAILRVRCRYSWWLARSRVVLWPSDELPPPSGSVLPVLEDFELRNPRADDGIFAQLPSSLRALALLTHPHTAHYMTPYNTSQPQGRDTLTPAELMHVLSLSRLPELRELRLSFRDLTDMRLFEYIARTFPRLQLLEFHSEAGEQRYWSAHEMIACARALSALRSLEMLRISTFGSVLSNKKWEDLARYNPPEELAAFEWGPRAIPLFRIVSALFDSEEMTGGCLLERFPLLREVWLPDVISVGYRTVFHNQRVWRIYHVDRDHDGRRCLRLEPGPHVE
ncbi:hypothetical protein EV715DRAFT_206006 [Schizophyllum commune]